MSNTYVRIILMLIVVTAVLGCSEAYMENQIENQIDKNWGRSFESAKYNQILNPQAGKNLEPVVGLSGETEIIIMDRYLKSCQDQGKGDKSKGLIN